MPTEKEIRETEKTIRSDLPLPVFEKSNRGRQKKTEQIKQMWFYRWKTGNWPRGMSDDMRWYYPKEYENAATRKPNKHQQYTEWRREFDERYSNGAHTARPDGLVIPFERRAAH